MDDYLIQYWSFLCESDECSNRMLEERLDIYGPDRKINLSRTETISVDEIKGRFHLNNMFKSRSDLFEDVDTVLFYTLKNDTHIIIKNIETNQYHILLPTTNDLARLFSNCIIRNNKTNQWSKVEDVDKELFVRTAETAKKVHTDMGNLLFKLYESSPESIKQLVDKEIKRYTDGSYEGGHFDKKDKRIELLKSMNGDYGDVIAGYSDHSISRGHHNQDMTMILTDKGIEFIINPKTNELVSVVFVDCYGMSLFYGRCTKHNRIPVKVIKSCLENDRNGYSFLDVDSSRIG